MIEICTVGGYSEVGRNMTAVKIDNEVVILDMGICLPKIIDFEELGGDRTKLNKHHMIKLGAIPNDNVIDSWKPLVKAIAIGHCHLDHIAAIPYLAPHYKAPILGTPYTIEVIKQMLVDDKFTIKNPLKSINPNSRIRISDNIELEFINITHSTLQTAMIAIHTRYGVIIYANDYKFDQMPIVGQKANVERLKEIGKENVIALIVDSLYSDLDAKTPSEKVAREMLKDVMLGTESSNNLIIATSFASHIARLKSIIDFGKKLERKIIFMGRSLAKYTRAAENLKLVNFSKEVEILGYARQIRRKLKDIEKNRTKYLLVCTGNQGEPEATLTKMARGDLPFKFMPQDHIIFSCKTIPDPKNIKNRAELEQKLKSFKVRLFKDIHVSVLPDTEVVVNSENKMKIKKISEIKEDKIRTAAFNPKTLKIGWYDANLVKHDYNGKIFHIKTKTGRRCSITSGHSVFILENGKIKEIKGDNLQPNDFLVIPKRFSYDKIIKNINMLEFIKFNSKSYSKDKKWIYYNNRKICPINIKLSYLFAKILGYYLAEGSAPRHLSFSFNKNEKDLIGDLTNCIKRVFPSNINIVDKGPNSVEIQFGANIIKNIFRKWFNSGAKNKKIPDFVFSSDNRFKLYFLGAYINGDGTIEDTKKHKRIRIKTASKKLASDLMYLFSQLGICAKLDHIEKIPERKIGANNVKESYAHVIRIQGRDDLSKLNKYLSKKFKDKIKNYINIRKIPYATHPPLAIPIYKLDLTQIKPKKNTDFEYTIKNNLIAQRHINPRLIQRDSLWLGKDLKKLLDGDLLFDPITEIKADNYKGDVYDLEVPGVENFIGGFGGLFFHNSGHAAREDQRDLINILKPRNIFPAHGDRGKQLPLIELAKEMGYNAHLMEDGKKITIQ